MTLAEGLLLVCLFAAIYELLRPLQRVVERWVLGFLGRHPNWVDAIIVKED